MRLALIPIAGTVAALIAILITRTPREEDRGPAGAAETPPAPVAPVFWLELREDGSLQDADTKQVYADVEEALVAIAPDQGGPRPQVRLFAKSERVKEEALGEVAERLKSRFEVDNLGHGAEER